MSEQTETVKCLIIGSGPAGYTAAIYAARADMQPVLYTGLQVGGQLTTTTEVENFPGYPKGIDGNMLMADLQAQAERFGTEIRIGMVTEAILSKEKGGVHRLVIDGEKVIETRCVIIATGASARYLGLPSEERLKGFGVSACAVCDGFFFKKQDVAVVGAGDSALEEAIYLSNLANKVYLLVRRDVMRASKAMQARVNKIQNIEILWNTNVEEVLGDQSVEGLRIINNKTGEKSELSVTGLFLAIGHNPNSEIFKGQLETDSQGYIVTCPGTSHTSLPGVFAAGDVQDTRYRQAITAAGSGCKAALDAEKYLFEISE